MIEARRERDDRKLALLRAKGMENQEEQKFIAPFQANAHQDNNVGSGSHQTRGAPNSQVNMGSPPRLGAHATATSVPGSTVRGTKMKTRRQLKQQRDTSATRQMDYSGAPNTIYNEEDME